MLKIRMNVEEMDYDDEKKKYENHLARTDMETEKSADVRMLKRVFVFYGCENDDDDDEIVWLLWR